MKKLIWLIYFPFLLGELTNKHINQIGFLKEEKVNFQIDTFSSKIIISI